MQAGPASYPDTGLVLLSLRDGSVQHTLPVGSDPVGVIVSADGMVAYVADSAPGDVYAVEIAQRRVDWKAHVGGAPFGMVLQGGRLYVTLYDAAAVAEIDAASGQLLASDVAPAHPAAITLDNDGHLALAAGSAFGIARVGAELWTADYRRSVLMPAGGGREVPLPLPVHPFWLAPGPQGKLLIAAEGESEDSDPGAVFSYDTVRGSFSTLARPRDPDQVIDVGGTTLVAAHGDEEVLGLGAGTTDHWAHGAAAVALAADPALNLLVVVVNSHE